jgi:hypothetical protein
MASGRNGGEVRTRGTRTEPGQRGQQIDGDAITHINMIADPDHLARLELTIVDQPN